MSRNFSSHFGRSFHGHHIEDACSCKQEACGLISEESRDSDCEQHSGDKTLRQIHGSDECPGVDDSWVDVAAKNAV